MNENVIPLDIFQTVRVFAPQQPENEDSSITVLENEKFYEIRSALPGVNADDVFVGVVDDVLTIGAKMCAETQRTLGRFFSIDHRVAMVEQSFALPPDAGAHHLTTTFHDGVLCVLVAREPSSNVVSLYTR